MLTIAILMTIFAAIIFSVFLVSIILNVIEGDQYNWWGWIVTVGVLAMGIFLIVGTWLLYNRIP